MVFRKTILFLFIAAVTSAAGCTTRYQDMLRERDERIRELSGDVARLRTENDELLRRDVAPQPVPASSSRDSEIDEVQDAVGRDASVYMRHGRISIGVEDSVTFDSGSTSLKPSAHKVLRNVAQVLSGKYGGRRFFIEGHTDTDPINKSKDRFRSNRHLSTERADAVAAYLIQQGVPEGSIVVVGYGQYDPRDPKSKAKNRRVEIVVGDRM
jgi:flagellar motor protein MotB